MGVHLRQNKRGDAAKYHLRKFIYFLNIKAYKHILRLKNKIVGFGFSEMFQTSILSFMSQTLTLLYM